jgi:alpha-ketoglutarate-dependent taurine dioxygenase
MATITITPLSETVGAEVGGVDRERLRSDPGLAEWALEALEANGVLVFPRIDLDDATHVGFSRRLGRPETFSRSAEFPEIFRVTLDPEKSRSAPYLRGTFAWHIDGLTEDVPIMATLLAAKAVDPAGGETEFASTYAAYDDLDDDEKARFASVRVVHTIEASQRLHNPDPSPAEVATWRRRPPKEHPLIWRHRSGRRSLVLGATADHVVGMDLDEGRAFLHELLERSTRPERVYRHRWQVGDLVIWDNRGVLHRACPYGPASPRDMHRTTLYGDEPVQ